jgi:hypothetical protein
MPFWLIIRVATVEAPTMAKIPQELRFSTKESPALAERSNKRDISAS